MGNCFSDGHDRGTERVYYPPPHGALPPVPPSKTRSFEQHDLRRQRSADVLQASDGPASSRQGHRRGSSYDTSHKATGHRAGGLVKSQSSFNVNDRRSPATGAGLSSHHSTPNRSAHSVQDVSKPSNFKQGIHISVDEEGNLQGVPEAWANLVPNGSGTIDSRTITRNLRPTHPSLDALQTSGTSLKRSASSQSIHPPTGSTGRLDIGKPYDVVKTATSGLLSRSGSQLHLVNGEADLPRDMRRLLAQQGFSDKEIQAHAHILRRMAGTSKEPTLRSQQMLHRRRSSLKPSPQRQPSRRHRGEDVRPLREEETSPTLTVPPSIPPSVTASQRHSLIDQPPSATTLVGQLPPPITEPLQLSPFLPFSPAFPSQTTPTSTPVLPPAATSIPTPAVDPEEGESPPVPPPLALLDGLIYPTSLVEDYEDLTAVAEGEAGPLYRARPRTQRDSFVAIKVIQQANPAKWQRIVSELTILRQHLSPHLVDFQQAFLNRESTHLWIVTTYLDGGSLTDLIQETPLAEKEVAYVCHAVLNALHDLHAKYCIHRDLRSDNVLFTKSGEIKLAEFNQAVLLQGPTQRRHSVVGTTYWMAPEVISASQSSNGGYDTKADIWSLAALMVEMLTTQPPYVDLPELRVLGPLLLLRKSWSLIQVRHSF